MCFFLKWNKTKRTERTRQRQKHTSLWRLWRSSRSARPQVWRDLWTPADRTDPAPRTYNPTGSRGTKISRESQRMSADVWPHSDRAQSGCGSVTHHRILSQVIIRPSCYGVQLHQVVEVRDLPVHPFLMTERRKSQLWTVSDVLYETEMLRVCSDLCESRGFEQLLRWVNGMKRERTQQQHPAVDGVTHLSIKQKQPIMRD